MMSASGSVAIGGHGSRLRLPVFSCFRLFLLVFCWLLWQSLTSLGFSGVVSEPSSDCWRCWPCRLRAGSLVPESLCRKPLGIVPDPSGLPAYKERRASARGAFRIELLDSLSADSGQ